MFKIKAKTALECKAEIVKWLDDYAASHRNQARMATRKGIATKFTTKAEAISDVSEFLKKVAIE